MRKILRLFLIFGIGLSLLGLSSPVEIRAREISLGFSFSPSYAEYLGLDPQDAYLEILDSFDFKMVRIPVYWDRAYQEGSYDFSESEFLVQEAKRRGLQVVLSFGYRNFRWPECYAPDELANLPYERFEEEVLGFEREVLEAFSKDGLVDFWQLENEPFLHFNFQCRFLRPATLTKSIEQIRYSDVYGRPILLTFGGLEVLGLPLIWPLIDSADLIGVSFYPRMIETVSKLYVEPYLWGPLAPRQISRERAFVEGKGKGYWVIEFQAEPWAEDPRTMSPEILRGNWNNILSWGGADRVFVWGPEWWLKEKAAGRPEVFEAAQNLFNLPFSRAELE